MPPKKKKKKPTYNDSLARERLHDCLRRGEIPLDSKEMSSTEAFLLYPDEFAQFGGDKRFPGRLSTARTAHKKLEGKSEEEMAALQHDRKIHPVPTHNHRGEPTWEGSEAQFALKHDLRTGTYDPQTDWPMELFESRPEYQEYELETFRKHIQQEIHLIKLINWKKSKSKLNK